VRASFLRRIPVEYAFTVAGFGDPPRPTRTVLAPHRRTTGMRTFPSGHATFVITAGTMRQPRKHEVPKATENVGGRDNRTFGFIGEG
jgi:hypothetical protein